MIAGTAIGTMTVAEIAFRGQGTALPLLVNQRPVSGPEWINGSPYLPAAFAAGEPAQGLGMEVTLRCTEPCGRIDLQAVRVGHAPFTTPIGDVHRTPVDFRGGTEARVPCRAALRRIVGLDTVRWRWEVDRGSGGWTPIGFSEHEMAVTLGEPAAPWGTNGGRPNETIPWWEVVWHACRAAEGATTIDEAATRITAHTFGGWGADAYRYGDSHHYASNVEETPAFDCAAFLRLVRREPGLPDLVDCSDLAAVVSTFANILGCNLAQNVIGSPIRVNPVLLSGHKEWESRDFGLHELTATRGGTTRVWDGCLLLSGDDAPNDPTGPPPVERVPAGMPEGKYLEYLLDGPLKQRRTLAGHGAVPGIRPIGPLANTVAALEPSSRSARAGAPHWTLPGIPVAPRFIIQDLVLADVATDGWHLIEVRAADPGLPSEGSDRVIRALWQSADSEALVSCDAYICASLRGAHVRTQALLGLASARPIAQLPPPADKQEPEFRFDVGRRSVLVGVVLNVAFAVRRASRVDSGEGVQQIFDAVRARILVSRVPVPNI